jgi:hypothetical protein
MREIDGARMMQFDRVITFVGSERRMVDADVFFDAFEELVEHYEDEGLSGEDLDLAVHAAMPTRLLELLGNHQGKPH